MSEKLNKVKEMLENDSELTKKLEEEFGRIAKSGNAATPMEANIQAVKTVLDVDISKDELEKTVAEMEELDPEEMDHFAGGAHDLCMKDYNCLTAWKHPDEQNKDAACAYDWMCVIFWKHHTNSLENISAPDDAV